MLDLGFIFGPKLPTSSTNFLTVLQSSIKHNQSFLQTIQKWKNLQQNYLSKLTQLQNEATQRNKKYLTPYDNQLLSILKLFQNQHLILLNKFNLDICPIDYTQSSKYIIEQKQILSLQKLLHKQLLSKKQLIQKDRNHKIKLKKNLQDQLILQVFSLDSVQATLDGNIRRFNRVKDIQKQQCQFDIKVKDTKQILDTIINKSKNNLKRFNQLQLHLLKQFNSISSKIKVHLFTLAKCLSVGMEDMFQQLPQTFNQQYQSKQINNQFISEVQLRIINNITIQQGYLQATLKSINDKTLDNIIIYSKNKQIKKRIKQILSSTQLIIQGTDQLSRQVKMIKNFLKTNDCNSNNALQQFINFISTSCQLRLNFVFILQMYRLKSQFQMSQLQLKPLILLIDILLQKVHCYCFQCHQCRDVFVLKQIMILLLTYYITYKHQQQQVKIYILHFFKDHPFWRDLDLWESLLILCIYLEKKATMKQLLSMAQYNTKNDLIEAQRTSVLNQMLYIVKNMVLFNFTQKQVKQFAGKFVKLFKLDDKFLKSIYKSIDTALEEQPDNKPPPVINQYIKSFFIKPQK